MNHENVLHTLLQAIEIAKVNVCLKTDRFLASARATLPFDELPR
jgi:hypothetical protein